MPEIHEGKQGDRLRSRSSSPSGTRHYLPTQHTQRHSKPSPAFELSYRETSSEPHSVAPISIFHYSDRSQHPPEAARNDPIQGGTKSKKSNNELSVIDQKWGLLFDDDSHPTLRLQQILQGLANYIAANLLPQNSIVVTPEKLALFYSYHHLETETYPFSVLFRARTTDFNDKLADLYQALDCAYYLVQVNTRSRPTIPCLTPVGFAQWLVTNIQAYPDEESRRLESIFSTLPIEIESPLDGKLERLPKQISRHLLPSKFSGKHQTLLDEAMTEFMYDFIIPTPISPSPSQPTRFTRGTTFWC